jgi:hypothetical protein
MAALVSMLMRLLPLALVAAIFAAAFTGSPEARRVSDRAPTFSAGATSAASLSFYTRANVSFRYPADWHVTTRRLDQVIDPRTLFAVASYVVPKGPPDTGHVPGYARGLRASGVFILVTEVLDHASLARILPRLHQKPRHFVIPMANSGGCLRCPGTTFQFRARSRAFYIYATIGPEASARTRRAAQAVLDSLIVSPR